MNFDGPLLDERWKLGPRLGAGAQADTRLAKDQASEGERIVVIKRLDVGSGEKNWKSFDLFEREIRTLQALRHAGIPTYLDSFESEGGVFNLVMERAPGASLRSWAKKRKFNEADLRDILRRGLGILRYLHGLRPPVIHRDIKPANLVRDRDGGLSLVDFGGVRDAVRVDGGSTVIGTFGYMAPEQLHGQASAATDLYGLGATIVALAGGVEPEKVPRKGLRMDLERHLAAVDPKLRGLLARMTEPDPDARPQSAVKVLEQLNELERKRLEPVKRAAEARSSKSAKLERRQPAAAATGLATEIDSFLGQLPGPARVALRALMFVIGASGWLGMTVVRYTALPILWAILNVAAPGKGTRRARRLVTDGFDEGRDGFASLALGRSVERPELPPVDEE